MSHPHDQLAAYVDGELDPTESEAFAQHLAGCAACRNELHDVLQLVALEVTARNPRPLARGSSPPVALHMAGDPAWDAPAITAMDRSPTAVGQPRRSRRRALGTGVFAAAAAVVVSVAAWQMLVPAREDPAAPLLVLTAPIRTIEGRISYAAADRHRSYDVVRAGGRGSASEATSLDTLAQLERRNDFHGVAAASLLDGDLKRAAEYLNRAAPGPDVAADRALIKLVAGQPEEALIALNDVLSAAPRHPQALWNRALALRDLGLVLSAAEAFEAVAALNESGWGDEARLRAHQLEADSREHRTVFMQLAREDGPRLATAPGAVTPDVARRFPGTTRLMFYDAVRTATSSGAVRALAPLAKTLDEVYGGNALTSYVERIAHADFTVRAPLARRYAPVARERLDAASRGQLLVALRAARADDILFGALGLFARNSVPAAAEIAELRRLGDATGDPWLHLHAIERAVSALVDSGDHAAAEALALPALATCETSRLDYRCVSLALTLADSYRYTLRLSDARRLLSAGFARARRTGEWYLEDRSLIAFAQVALLSNDVVGSTLAVVRAYTHELTLREPERCDFEIWGSGQVALLLVNRLDLAGARAELARADAELASCPQGAGGDGETERLFAAAHVLRDPAAGTTRDVERVRLEIAHARTTARPVLLPLLDQIEGRLMLDRDRATGTALLEHAIATADANVDGDVNGPRARAYSYELLVLDAARAGEWERVWTLLGRAARVPAANRCALGLAVESGTSMAVARDATGASRGWFNPHSGPNIDPARLVPAELRDFLRACPEVEVLARPSAQGVPGVLPAELAWSYRLDREAATTARDNSAAPPPARAMRVVIANTEPPPALGAARLLPWRSAEPPDVELEGPRATPSRALEELSNATFVEIHAHGGVDAFGASFLMLSPDRDGGYALTASAIRNTPLRGRPIVILAACNAAKTATHRDEAWGLPAAFIAAGARAVIASTEVIDDASAGAFFDDVRARIQRGASPVAALRDARSAWQAVHKDAAWVRPLMVFQ
jgi:hypothetical protein